MATSPILSDNRKEKTQKCSYLIKDWGPENGLDAFLFMFDLEVAVTALRRFRSILGAKGKPRTINFIDLVEGYHRDQRWLDIVFRLTKLSDEQADPEECFVCDLGYMGELWIEKPGWRDEQDWLKYHKLEERLFVMPEQRRLEFEVPMNCFFEIVDSDPEKAGWIFLNHYHLKLS